MTGGTGRDAPEGGPVGVPELESVTGPGGRVEVIGDLDPDDGPPAGERAATWLRDRARRRPGVAAALAALALVAVMVPAGTGVRQLVHGPQLATGLTVLLESGTGQQALWPTGDGARPGGPPTLPSLLGISVPAGDARGLTVTGLSGPGVVRDDAGPAELTEATAQATLKPVLDCDRLPADAAPGDYRIALRVRDGDRTGTRTVPLPPGGGWVEAAQQACRAWRARRDLTVTTLDAVVDPTGSRLTLTMSVTDSGPYPAVLGPSPSACCVGTIRSGAAVTVPSGGSVTAGWDVSLDTCDSVTSPSGGGATVTVVPLLSDEIGLEALAGPGLPDDLTGFGPSTGPADEQIRPLGVVLSPEASAALAEGLHRACGGLSQPALLIGPRTVRLSRPAGRVTVDAVLDVTPGRVGRVTLTTDRGERADDEYRALWSSIGPLVPDRSGQVPVRLTYQVTGSARGCLPYGGVLPPITLTLDVPEGGRVRTVRYTSLPTLSQDPTVVPRLCPG